ncbi:MULTISPECIES: AfsR/SARP family transcriptional regulator [unclassified Arthrobacter]|uniref:AfsR/SARP family transcriptional regulator n=1 Tax=unclassified Arthrobacter TaxID=235627 RepID=UPI00149226A9|nr:MULTISPECIES: BTAD domain-containing putative transcriptional regulator [unclassified Arthrobacter]MBE0011428.1 transcriptional regulator [Arthrobacter sp. AET 35A]NOJ59488.1 transcriptional regulator [Arthrobacter sp. 260]
MSSNTPVQWNLKMLGYWCLERDHQPVTVAFRQQRLIAALALRGGRRRSYIAGLLWPNRTDAQASGSLRACLWNIAHQLPGLLHPVSDPLALAPGITIDVDELLGKIDLVDAGATVPQGFAAELRSADLLPGWDEDWLLPDQDRIFRQRLAALETLADTYLASGQLPAALDAATAAVALDPLLESAQRSLLRIHLAAGNNGSAMRSYRTYLATLKRECGVRPSARITELIRPLQQAQEPTLRDPAPGYGVSLHPSFD